jgi:hypothetical protein
MQIYGEITKIEPQDDGTIKVSGIASSGAVDEADETVLPAAMKAALPSYMRFGALREMHGLSAAGATLSAEVGDDGLTRIETHVVDPLAVKKVQLGVYKGFSIGGKVLARDPADRRVITKIKLDEISLVDRPCNPEAVIDMWKAERAPDAPAAAAPANGEVIARAKALAAAAGRPGRHTDFVVKAREALILERRAAQGDGDDSVDDQDGAAAEDQTGPSATTNPKAVADRLDAILAGLDPDDAAEALAELIARWSDDDDGDDDDNDTAAAKAGWPPPAFDDERLTRAMETVAARQIGDLRRCLDRMGERLDKLAAEPVAPKAAAGQARAVSKTEDAAPSSAQATLSAEEFKKYLDSLPQDERGQLQLRAALRSPIPLVGR